MKKKKATKIIAMALAKAKNPRCPNPWSLSHRMVRGSIPYCEWIDCSSMNYDEIVHPGRFYLEEPVIVKGFKVFGDEDGAVHIHRIRDGREVITGR